MRNYIYIDRLKLDWYVGQVQGLSNRAALSEHDKIEALIQHHRNIREIQTTRPRYSWEKNEAKFVLEKMDACKLIFPREILQVKTDLKELAVWISEPDPTELTFDSHSAGGTFVYLTEMRCDEQGRTPIWSGCSALQAIANFVQGKNLIEPGPSGEPLGEGRYLHPVKKLLQQRAIMSLENRKIESLYYVRYMSDEQCYERNGVKHRVHDLLGYPIFISVL